MKEKTIHFPFHRELVEEYERLKTEVKWIGNAKCLEDLRSAVYAYQLADYNFNIIRSRKIDGDGLGWYMTILKERLWDRVKKILQEKGYDRKWFIHRDGKVGLERAWPVSPGIPAEYDEILITFDHQERMEKPIPVKMDGKCSLVSADGENRQLCPFEYDLIFREPWSKWVCYIAKKGDYWGILDVNGKEIVPCDMDHIYGRSAHDGVILLEKDGKYGVFDDVNYVYPEYEDGDIIIEAEDMVKVRKGGKWGWLDVDGLFTLDRDRASFSNYDDDDK